MFDALLDSVGERGRDDAAAGRSRDDASTGQGAGNRPCELPRDRLSRCKPVCMRRRLRRRCAIMAMNAKNMPADELFFRAQGMRWLWRFACGPRGTEGARSERGGGTARGLHERRRLQLPPVVLCEQRDDHAFAATAAVLTGIEAGLRAQGKKPDDCTVVGFAGDGGTADIGIQALSGAIDRNDDVLYICYDNEAYMNTGIQKNSLTPSAPRPQRRPQGRTPTDASRRRRTCSRLSQLTGLPMPRRRASGI